MATVEGLVVLGVAGLLLAVGYLIRVRGWVFLIAGYDPEGDVPPEFAGRVVGNAVLRVGVATGIVGVAAGFGLGSSLLWGAYAVAVLLAAGRAVHRLNTHPATD